MSLIVNANYLRKVADGFDVIEDPTTLKLHDALIALADGFDAHVAVVGQEADTLDDYLAAASGVPAVQAAVDALGIADVAGLQAALDAKASTATTSSHDVRLDAAESGITALQGADTALQSAIDAVDAALTTEVSDRTSGDAGLQASIDAITTILASDDAALDTAQERVDKIKQLIADVDTLAIVDVSGLQSALDAKATTATVGALDTRVGTAETDITALQAGGGGAPLSDNPELNDNTYAASTVATTTLATQIAAFEVDIPVQSATGGDTVTLAAPAQHLVVVDPVSTVGLPTTTIDGVESVPYQTLTLPDGNETNQLVTIEPAGDVRTLLATLVAEGDDQTDPRGIILPPRRVLSRIRWSGSEWVSAGPVTIGAADVSESEFDALNARVAALEGAPPVLPSGSITWTDTTGPDIAATTVNLADGTVVSVSMPGGTSLQATVASDEITLSVSEALGSGQITASAVDANGSTVTASGTYIPPQTDGDTFTLVVPGAVSSRLYVVTPASPVTGPVLRMTFILATGTATAVIRVNGLVVQSGVAVRDTLTTVELNAAMSLGQRIEVELESASGNDLTITTVVSGNSSNVARNALFLSGSIADGTYDVAELPAGQVSNVMGETEFGGANVQFEIGGVDVGPLFAVDASGASRQPDVASSAGTGRVVVSSSTAIDLYAYTEIVTA